MVQHKPFIGLVGLPELVLAVGQTSDNVACQDNVRHCAMEIGCDCFYFDGDFAFRATDVNRIVEKYRACEREGVFPGYLWKLASDRHETPKAEG